MAKGQDKQAKAVKKIKRVVRKAVDKGVSPQDVSAAVDDAIADSTGDAAAPAATAAVTAKTKKLPGLHKSGDVTLKRGVILDNSPARVESSPEQEVEAAVPEIVKPKLKKLPGKRKPPTLTLKYGGINAAAAPASKKAAKVTGLNKQTDVAMKRG